MKPLKIENEAGSNMKSTIRYTFVAPGAIGKGRGRGLKSLGEKGNTPSKSLLPQSSDLVKKYIKEIETSSTEKDKGQGLKRSTIFTSQGMQTIYKNSMVPEKENKQINLSFPTSAIKVEKCTQEVETSSMEKDRGQGLKKSTIFTSQGMQTIYKNSTVEKCTQEVETMRPAAIRKGLEKRSGSLSSPLGISESEASSDRIWSRIDSAFGNSNWMMKWGHVQVEYELPHISDHSPMFLQVTDEPRGGRLPFKFFNVWVDHPNFLTLVLKVWRQPVNKKGMEKIWYKLKLLKSLLKDLNIKEFKNVRSNTVKAREELKRESILKQKSRVTWIKLGDSLSKYFSAVMKERTHKKLIGNIQALNGCKLQDPKAIQQEIISFYQSPMGASQNRLPAVDRRIMKLGPILVHQQQLDLCEEITDQEIWEGLRSIDDDKSPGIDGYTSCFLKKAWQMVKDDICSAVREFFITGAMCKAINCTSITLVLKIPSPVTVKDYRPIACCTVLYKIISKIITSRMQKIMPCIICEAQTGFIPGRRISDKIILAQELVQDYTRTRKRISARCTIKIDLQKAYVTSRT
ncbi:hypothetical protein MTR67_022157 [Solanum verrucosum]|uniref:Reverse transcriptase domain-containing protein n=1 Tax=Solanum verrucosum TaxID=315347 RepID=A0AAF0QU99_SOLVR|nr:hypothetical protein MTR67_022157 [Solanum verrucosum]